MSGPEADLADVVADAVLGVRGVAGLYAGRYGEIGTYLPGRRVPGVRLDVTTTVHVVLGWGADVAETTDAVRRAVLKLTGAPVDVVVEDVAAPGIRA